MLDEHTVAYLDLVGSGAETVAHLQDNGRIVVMLCAFEGPPRIVRLHGRGEVLEPGAVDFPDADALPEQHRTVIRVAVERIADSCGFGVPLMAYEGERPQSQAWARDEAGQGRPARARGLRGREERGEHRRAARARLTAMRFEKWQALANDYVIVEASELAARRAERPSSCARCATATRASAPTACSSSRRPTSPASSRGCGSSTPTAPRPS